MKKKYKSLLIIIFIFIIIVGGLFVFKYFGSDFTNNVKVVDTIDNFNYTLDKRDTKLMKDNYDELKRILKKDIDYKEYASILAKLFVIDLFTIDNKINKYDVGSLEYVHPDFINNFSLNVEDTIYKHVQNNSNGKRRQQLPVVASVNIEEINECNYNYLDKAYEGYEVKLSWTYEKDLEYDDEALITLIKVDNKLYVSEYKTGEENE